ncbi:MAG: TPM domain-containing protein [Bacteroidota bacterium]
MRVNNLPITVSFSRTGRNLLLLLLLLVSTLLVAQRPIPAKTNDLVNDYAGMMSRGEQDQLRRKLVQYALETSTQIAVVTEPSLQGETAFDRGLAIAHGWGIGGSEEKDNGVLIYVARDDRKIQILTGYGAEGFLPDILAKRIIEQDIKPAFRQGKIYVGLNKATDTVMKLGKGEYKADDVPAGNSGGGGIPPLFIVFFIIVIFYIISYYNNRRNDDDDDDGGYWRNGPYDMDDHDRKVRRRRRRGGGGWVIFPGGGGFGGGGGGGFGGGGGDFGGFGGGGFGGGGAGGDW